MDQEAMMSELEGTGCELREPFAAQVLDNSMEPEFPERCVVLIDPVDRFGPGSFVFAEVDGERWFRQYREDGQGRRWLAALNEIYPDIEIGESGFQVLGVVIQRNIRRKIKHYPHLPEGVAAGARRH